MPDIVNIIVVAGIVAVDDIFILFNVILFYIVLIAQVGIPMPTVDILAHEVGKADIVIVVGNINLILPDVLSIS